MTHRVLRWAGCGALVPLTLLVGCSEGIDQAHTLQTRLVGIDGVTTADVSAPSVARAAEISLRFDPSLTAADVGHLVKQVARAAANENYPSYRLGLSPADGSNDTLVVDDSFAASPVEAAVVANWLAVDDAVLGTVTYTFESSNETITVDSGAAAVHDVTEISRIGYGSSDTSWSIAAPGSTFVVTGRVSSTDVQLFQQVQRSVGSSSLPVPSSSWRLERRGDLVRLDLQVGLPREPVAPAAITRARFGGDLRHLARAALDSVAVADLPIWLELRHAGASGNDVFGYWISDQRPVPGRDRLGRGWDRWLAAVAASAGR